MAGCLKTWTRCSALFVSAALAWARPAHACADMDITLRHATFETTVLCRADEAPFVLDLNNVFATGEGLQAPDFTQVNLEEWVAFFGGKIPAEAWSTLLYKDPLPRLDALIFALKGKAPPGPADAIFLSYPDRETLVAALFYVGFAKRAERFVPQRLANYWDVPAKPAEADAPTALIAAGKKAHVAATNPFLRQRYAFQLLRLHFHHSPPAEGLRFFQENAADFATLSSAAWRAKGLAAGLLRKARRLPEANVAYLELFDRYPPLKTSAFQSLRWPDDATWNRTLELAKTTREKTLLWQALGYRADAPRAMKAIRELDPGSDLLPLLVGRELNRLEEDFVAFRDRPVDAATRTRLETLMAFVEAGSEKGNVAGPAGWDVAAGHLRVLSGDAAGAQRFFERAATRGRLDAATQQQLRASRFYAAIETKKPLTDDAGLMHELEWLWPADADSRLGSLRTLAKQKLAATYAARGDVFPAVCIGGDVGVLHAEAKQAAGLADFLGRDPTGPVETFARSHCAFELARVRELQGLYALYAGDLDQAAPLLGSIKTEPLRADPFFSRIVDCHDCDAAAPKHAVYTRAQFVKRLASLAQEAGTQPAKAAQKQFELATGLYNMTWYGNARAVSETPSYDLKPAETAFRKALQLAGKDRELAARATFGLAKCEQGQFLTTRADQDGRDFVAGPAFKSMAASYANTKYCREVLAECGYFRTFVKGAR